MGLLAGTKWDRPPHCERCDKPETECTCPPLPTSPARVPAAKQTARLQLERRKHGRTVTVVRGLSAAQNDLPDLLSRLKSACGAGGTVQADELELQGDQITRVKDVLTKLGYKVRG